MILLLLVQFILGSPLVKRTESPVRSAYTQQGFLAPNETFKFDIDCGIAFEVDCLLAK